MDSAAPVPAGDPPTGVAPPNAGDMPPAAEAPPPRPTQAYPNGDRYSRPIMPDDL